MPGNDLSEIFNNIPFVTRYWFSGTILFSLLGKLNIIDPMRMILLWNRMYSNFEIWRPITALLFYPVSPSTGFHFLINLYFLYSYSSRLENGMFLGRTADYVFMFLFTWLVLVVSFNLFDLTRLVAMLYSIFPIQCLQINGFENINFIESSLTCLQCVSFLASFYVLLEPMVLTVLYIWSQLNRDIIVQFWFGMQFKAMYFPWVLVIFNLIVRGSAMMELVGIIVGHLYYFFVFQYPQEYGGQAILKTPGFLYRIFPNQRGVTSGFGEAPRARQPTMATGRFPGHGQVLGDGE
ncbi:Derlin-1 [Schistosoma japonicum]|nr:Derlin-1 [Schistosoma japonicum]